MKTYKVKFIKKNTKDLQEDCNSIWEKANSLLDFNSPWNNEPVKKIEFKAFHNSENIFFRFKVDDDEQYIYPSSHKNDSINNSDRVELFFRSDSNLNPYYCLEIDTTSRIMDFEAKPNKEFDFNWNWPSKHLKVESKINSSNFIVDITISIQSLKDLSLLKDNLIETGIYRAKYNQIEDGSYEPTWITWVNPNTTSPNFHIPSSFGLLELEKNK